MVEKPNQNCWKNQRCAMYFSKTNQTEKVNSQNINKVTIQTPKKLFDRFPHKLTALEWNEWVPKTLFYLIKISAWIPTKIQWNSIRLCCPLMRVCLFSLFSQEKTLNEDFLSSSKLHIPPLTSCDLHLSPLYCEIMWEWNKNVVRK